MVGICPLLEEYDCKQEGCERWVKEGGCCSIYLIAVESTKNREPPCYLYKNFNCEHLKPDHHGVGRCELLAEGKPCAYNVKCHPAARNGG